MHKRLFLVWTLSVATAAPMAWAQSGPDKPDPLDAHASVPPAVYRSSLSGYRLLPDEEVRSWKESNDEVGRIGGWRAYAKEAQAPEPAGASTPPGADKLAPVDGAKPMQGRSGGHKMN
ncbi:MAG: hypothetical protein IH604_08250 [Burkholderiales bacterium]|nr:hypothetical protein [Burkholderiales bacterium]